MSDMGYYGRTRFSNKEILVPEGWVAIPEGDPVPHEHRECIENYIIDGWVVWCRPRRTISTMTPVYARVWGGVRMFAAKEIDDEG